MISVAAKANKRIMKGLNLQESKLAEMVLFRIKLNLKDIHAENAISGKPDEVGTLPKVSEEDL